MVGEGGSMEEGCRRRRRLDGEGFPVVEGGREGAGELRRIEAKLDVGSIWAQRLWRRGSTAGLRLAGVRWSGGGIPVWGGKQREGEGNRMKGLSCS
jgi:hypothetical protein